MIIPDKICPHCGGNEWYKRLKKENNKVYVSYECVKRAAESTKIYHTTPEGKMALRAATKVQRKKLSDSYVLNVIGASLYHHNIKLNRKDVTKEQIEMYRQSIKAKRKLKQEIMKANNETKATR